MLHKSQFLWFDGFVFVLNKTVSKLEYKASGETARNLLWEVIPSAQCSLNYGTVISELWKSLPRLIHREAASVAPMMEFCFHCSGLCQFLTMSLGLSICQRYFICLDFGAQSDELHLLPLVCHSADCLWIGSEPQSPVSHLASLPSLPFASTYGQEALTIKKRFPDCHSRLFCMRILMLTMADWNSRLLHLKISPLSLSHLKRQQLYLRSVLHK